MKHLKTFEAIDRSNDWEEGDIIIAINGGTLEDKWISKGDKFKITCIKNVMYRDTIYEIISTNRNRFTLYRTNNFISLKDWEQQNMATKYNI